VTSVQAQLETPEYDDEGLASIVFKLSVAVTPIHTHPEDSWSTIFIVQIEPSSIP